MLNKYDNDVYGNKLSWIQSIFDSFRNDDSQINHVMYLEERLFILEKLMGSMEYKISLEFLTVLQAQLLVEPIQNFLVYCANPLKIIIMLLNITNFISKKHQNLKFKSKLFRSTLWDTANAIIDSSSSINEVEDMLRDTTYNGIEVINMIEYLDIIEILQNPLMDNIISNMYLGPYEREYFISKSIWYKIIDEHMHLYGDTKVVSANPFKLFEINNSFKHFAKHFKNNTKLFKRCKRESKCYRFLIFRYDYSTRCWRKRILHRPYVSIPSLEINLLM